jgi:hypothetical protein
MVSSVTTNFNFLEIGIVKIKKMPRSVEILVICVGTICFK